VSLTFPETHEKTEAGKFQLFCHPSHPRSSRYVTVSDSVYLKSAKCSSGRECRSKDESWPKSWMDWAGFWTGGGATLGHS